MVKEEFNGIVEKIIASKSFGRSGTYANLLRYLVTCSLNKNVPKETTIASEIFGKTDFDPSQSTLIRVYVYNLRKKLKAYYQNEGDSDEKRLTIPKGSYAIEVIERKEGISKPPLSHLKKWVIPLATALLLSLALNLYQGTAGNEKTIINEDGLWADLIGSKLPTMLVMGDLFVYNERDTILQLTRTIRDPGINSLQEFEVFKSINTKTDTEIEPLTYTHLILGSAQWIKKLSEVFYAIDKDFIIRTMSRFNPKQLQDYDLIVVGMQKTLGVFKSFYKDSAFDYDVESDAFLYTSNENDKILTYKPKGNADSYHTDYSLLTKVPGPNGNTIYLFSGIWDTGATQSLKNFTEAKLLQGLEAALQSKFGYLPEYYEVFFEVNGIDRMELSSKILYMHKLNYASEP
ncbi:hypothetical protein [Ulvibacterium sp.]|uniref:hypothetical protein n=1 Tax=Ulvibacterium sp. TaxID=2665914 RepID=UPI00260AF830|nr:hypothetical protein [Ulvibacterium sp.]